MNITITRAVDERVNRKYVKVYKDGRDVGYLIYINDAYLYRGELKNPKKLLVCDDFISCSEERLANLEDCIKNGNIVSWARFRSTFNNRPYYFKNFGNRHVALVFEIYN